MSISLPARSQEETIDIALDRTVASGKAAADRVMEQFKKSNLTKFLQAEMSQELMLMKSLWVHHRLRAVDLTVGGLPLTIDLMNLCISGDIETAAFIISQMVPDDMSQPFHFLSADVLSELGGLLAAEC
jgi:hypothetical protein